ncbi:paeninodin family lasso peptide [Paenibacillus sp. sptzw28]|uniref:paeninodin family lasso peptide n=1 Tax=Paenibacillus sp. sptzw28 TaxID=715179 RepID=UPI001C6EB18D|nr:paeninodin family lasso peptide [Paenibacillus sp. sptzw28]QYR19441.1 paeninodin family lasso peptide [Paenibacillus sp. sptzw28]
MEKKAWKQPSLETLDVSMTMAGKGTWIDFKGMDANPHTPPEHPGHGKPPES